ncbi:MAG: exosome complex protein Rrp4 [Candidatus Diapherotrites archaeon]
MAKRIVIPGELVTEERKKLGSHVFVREGKIYSDAIGLVNDESDFASVVPLEGKYLPQVGDVVIGVISAEKFSVYMVDINSFYPSVISKRDLREILKPGSVVSAKIMKVNELNEVDLANPRIFFGGEIIQISPVKVPRIIGREGSMLNILKDGTKTSIIVGRNGRIWAKGGDIELLKKAVKKIEDEAHLSNLTNKMQDFLKVKPAKKNEQEGEN